MEFHLNQRYTSEAEPELGLGIVTETSKGRVKIDFPMSGETRLYAAANAPLRRARFKPGDTIADQNGRSLLVESVEEDGPLILYIGKGRSLSEADLGNVTVKHGADDRLLMGDTDPPHLFALRRRTLENDHNRRISPINGFVGGRIDLIPHQLYIAHEVSGRYAPRVLLSDEVGLGKTIEACLILHRLLLSGRISRVLILVPESLVHQWFVEILRRFNLWFHIFDEERCLALDGSAPEGNPFLDDQLVLCSTAFLAGSPKRAQQALAADWDMLVVDEAHHLEWSIEQASPEYLVVEYLSKVAEGLLLLTATPEQLGLESHFARLRLLDPARYSDFEAFKKESNSQKETAKIVEKLTEGKPLNAYEKGFLESTFGKERLEVVQKGKEEDRKKLIQDLLDQHGPGRVIFRNTRSAMTGFPKRKAQLVPLSPQKDPEMWIQRLSAEFEADHSPQEADSEPQPIQFAKDPRLDWLADFMEDIQPQKVLLICTSKEKVLGLEDALRKRIKLKVGVFHEDLTLLQRDRNAAWFSEPNGAGLLLCSEIGSEGRNFQFAHHLVLFDLPVNPELLEQRIGRLDRIGQSEDIQIHVPYLEGSPQEVLVKWYHEGLNAFEQNLEGGNRIAQLFRDRLLSITLSLPSADSGKQIASLIADTQTAHSKLKENLTEGRDRLLEMNSFNPEVAEKLIAEIRAEDLSPTLETYMTDVFEEFGIETEDLAPQTYLLHPPLGNAAAFPAIPDEGISVTFDRKRALSREDIAFLTWDHPMVTGAIDMVLGTGTGSASYGVLKASGPPAILLEVLFVLETMGGQHLNVDRFLPGTPLRVVINHIGADVTEKYPVEILDQQLRLGEIEDLLENETLVETLIPNMIAAANQSAEDRGMLEISKGLVRMTRTLNHEINRLQSLQQKNGHVRPEEVKNALEARLELSSLIKNAGIRLDALRLIQKG